MGLLPLWLGRAGEGASHTHAPLRTRVSHFMASVCSSAPLCRRLVVGGCLDWRRPYLGNATDASFLSKLPFPTPVEVVSLYCGMGSNLPARLLRYAQEQLRNGNWTERYVWYSEGDQVLHLSPKYTAQDLFDVLNRKANSYYLLPNRLEQVYNASGEGQGRPVLPWDGERFKVNNDCRGEPIP